MWRPRLDVISARSGRSAIRKGDASIKRIKGNTYKKYLLGSFFKYGKWRGLEEILISGDVETMGKVADGGGFVEDNEIPEEKVRELQRLSPYYERITGNLSVHNMSNLSELGLR